MTERKELPENVTDVLGSGKIFMYGLSYCGPCHMTLQTLSRMNCNHEYIFLDKVQGIQEETFHEINRVANLATYPKVFMGDEPIGGFTDLLMLYKTGDLKKVLEKHNIVCHDYEKGPYMGERREISTLERFKHKIFSFFSQY